MDWVRDLIAPDDLTTAARRAGFDKSTMTRWKQGRKPEPTYAIQLARAYGASPVEALVVLGLIRRDECDFVPVGMRDAIRSAAPEMLADEAYMMDVRATSGDAAAESVIDFDHDLEGFVNARVMPGKSVKWPVGFGVPGDDLLVTVDWGFSGQPVTFQEG